jgi:uncharacterized protein
MATLRTRPVLGVDLDNVLSLTDPLIRWLIAEMYEIRLEQSDIVQFAYSLCGITEEQEAAVLGRFHDSACSELPLLDGAAEALVVLREVWEIHIVTGRPDAARALTLDWLERHGLPYDQIDFLKFKHQSPVPFTAFVDDHRETSYAMAKRGVFSMLFDYPWNQPPTDDPTHLVRVRSWDDVVRHLSQLA